TPAVASWRVRRIRNGCGIGAGRAEGGVRVPKGEHTSVPVDAISETEYGQRSSVDLLGSAREAAVRYRACMSSDVRYSPRNLGNRDLICTGRQEGGCGRVHRNGGGVTQDNAHDSNADLDQDGRRSSDRNAVADVPRVQRESDVCRSGARRARNGPDDERETSGSARHVY